MLRRPKNIHAFLESFRPLLGIVLLSVLVLDAAPTRAQSEDEIKAAFLLNFARYVEWPVAAFSSADSPVRVCMLEAGDFGKVVRDTIAGKSVGARSVEVVGVDAALAAADCHILFLESESGYEGEVLETLGESSVFTVASDTGFAKNGGIANFFRAGNRIRFEINPRAARGAGLNISSRLLRLAQVVE